MSTRGLGRSYQRDGSWWIVYHHRGRRYRESVARALKKAPADVTPTDATRLLKRRLGEGRPAGREAERISFEQMLGMVTDDYAVQERRSTPPMTRLREYFRRQAEDPALEVVRPATVARYVRARLEASASRGTVRNEVSVLQRGLTLVYRELELPHRPRLPMPRAGAPRAGFFTDDKIAKLLARLPAHLRAFVETAYITGWRRSELRNLRWSQVDWDAGTIRLEPGTTKNGEGRTFLVFAHPRLAAVLREQREATSALEHARRCVIPWVFHNRGRKLAWYYCAWHTACDNAGMPGRLFHDLRRSAVRNLVAAGVSERVAMTLTGHKTRAVFHRYHIVAGTDQVEAVAKLAARHAAGAAPTPRKVLAIGARSDADD